MGSKWLPCMRIRLGLKSDRGGRWRYQARIKREDARGGMQDRVCGLEEVNCQIGVQKGGRMDMTDLHYYLSQSTRLFLRSTKLFHANHNLAA